MLILIKKGVDFELIGYVDPDLGGDLDDHKFTSGYVFSCGSRHVSYVTARSKIQCLSLLPRRSTMRVLLP